MGQIPPRPATALGGELLDASIPVGPGPSPVIASPPLARIIRPLTSVFGQVGDVMILTARTIGSAVRPPYPYGEEFIGQFLFALQLCWFPLLISTVAINLGAPGLQAANFLSLLGALDRLGGFFVLAAIREIGPFVTAVVVAGVAGTAITADLGARKIREELDALQVLGVDPIKNLVVPRFLALRIDHRPPRHLRTGLRAERRNPHRAPLPPAAGRLPRDPLLKCLGNRPRRLGTQVHDVRRDHRRGQLLQGNDRLGRCGRSGTRGKRGGGDLLPWSIRLQLRLHPNDARHQSRTADGSITAKINWDRIFAPGEPQRLRWASCDRAKPGRSRAEAALNPP